MNDPATDASVSWRALRDETEARLTAAGLESATREAIWLVEEASGRTYAELALDWHAEATVDQSQRLAAMVERRLRGEPVQYVLGHWAFRSLDLLVDGRVLIPRPETEQVAEVALAELDRMSEPSVVADLGTGSGALALAIATERPGIDVWAVERDHQAATVARVNVAAQGHAGNRVRVVEGCWFDPLPPALRGTLDLVVTNPPYVATEESLPPSVSEWEPASALYAGPEGLDAIAEIFDAAVEWLAPHGVLVVEIGATQGAAASDLARRAGFAEVEVHPDLAGRDRALVARMTSR